MAGDEILKIVGCGDALGLTRSQEVLLDRICVVAERDFDGAFESVNVAVVAGTLVRSVNTH